jgi:hypothetical protein
MMLRISPYPTFPRVETPHLNPLGETTSHSTRLQETAAKSLVIPLAGEEANVKGNLQFPREKGQS